MLSEEKVTGAYQNQVKNVNEKGCPAGSIYFTAGMGVP